MATRPRYVCALSVALLVVSAALRVVTAQNTSQAPKTPAGRVVAPVVVELFTSEGCSSCPSADRALSDLVRAGMLDGIPIIALSEHVDYWNRLGWKDRFSSSKFTMRQTEYAEALESKVYTPQMVFDGRFECIGNDRVAVVAAISKAGAVRKARVSAQIARDGSSMSVHATIEPGDLERLPDADVFVAVTENGLVSNVLAGENKGRQMPHDAVTRHLEKAGRVKAGTAPAQVTANVRLEPEWTLAQTNIVVLVKARGGKGLVGAWSGPIEPKLQSRIEGR
jgi:hypothetical protein